MISMLMIHQMVKRWGGHSEYSTSVLKTEAEIQSKTGWKDYSKKELAKLSEISSNIIVVINRNLEVVLCKEQ